MTRIMRPQQYKALPEIYQVEATNACNLSCPRCHRRDAAHKRGGVTNLDPAQLEGWLKRGDFRGSWYVELQMSGEPLVHPEIGRLVRMLQAEGLLVGMATNGMMLERKAAEVCNLDAITVSIDSDDADEYAHHRSGGTLARVEAGIAALLAQPTRPRYLNIFTIAGLDEAAEEVAARMSRMEARFPDFTVTFAADTLAARYDPERHTLARDQEICINPWTSVSVQSDGSVVSCCYAWDHAEPNYLGDLNEESLSWIWRGSAANRLRKLMTRRSDRGHCKTCYARSPFLLHLDGLARALRARRDP